MIIYIKFMSLFLLECASKPVTAPYITDFACMFTNDRGRSVGVRAISCPGSEDYPILIYQTLFAVQGF